MATHSAAVDDAAAASAAAPSPRTTNRAGRQMQWGRLYSYSTSVGDASRSGACKLYCHVDLPPSSFDPPARCRRRCGPCDSPCKDCAASAPVTVIIRGACSLPSVMSQIQTQALQLQALDLNALQPPLGLAGARAVSDILPRLRSLLALALDNNELRCAGVQVISRELKNLTQLQVVSLADNGVNAEGAGSLALVLSSLTGLQTLDLGYNSISAAGAGSLALVLSSLTGLQTLDLDGNSISDAGAGSLALVLSSLTGLQTLILGDNSISAAGASLLAYCSTSLKRLRTFTLDTLPSAAVRCSAWLQHGLPVPPAEVVSSGWLSVLHYLSSADKAPVHKIRMLVIGDSEMGKTSLVRALQSRDHCAQVISAVDRTVGIDISPLVLTGAGPSVNALLYDLAGQDVYTVSHAMHFTARCIYLLLWKPGASLECALASVGRWLETLVLYVPDAVVVLVGSHCESLPEDEYRQLSASVLERVQAKVAELNDLTKLEVMKLHELYKCAVDTAKAATGAYKAASTASDSMKRAEAAFESWMRSARNQNQMPSEEKSLSEWQLRAQAQAILPRSLRILASRVQDANQRAAVLRGRLCVLLALRDGAEPHDSYPPAAMSLHSACVDSVAGLGIAELQTKLHEMCMGLTFMGELLPKAWLDVAQALPSLSSGLLTVAQATHQVRVALAAASVDFGGSDEEMARILRFWSRVGEIFV